MVHGFFWIGHKTEQVGQMQTDDFDEDMQCSKPTSFPINVGDSIEHSSKVNV
jgi:hypothetical protein